jgi:chitodextrinase
MGNFAFAQATTTGFSNFLLGDDQNPNGNLPPIVDAGPDQTVLVNTVVQFNGSATHPDINSLTFAWNFGDGNKTNGSLTPTHVYQEAGLYTVTLTVSDSSGYTVSDTLQVIVESHQLHLPLVVRASQ